MRFFPRKGGTVSKDSDEHIVKEELEARSEVLQAEADKSQSELDKIQEECEERRAELQDITQKVQTVKKEYDMSVDTLMSVKKDLNQSRMDLDSIHREYGEVSTRIRNSETGAEIGMSLARARDLLLNTRNEIRRATQEREKIREQAEQEKTVLSGIREEIRKAAEHGDAGEQRVLSGIREEVRKATQEREKIREQAEQEKTVLSGIREEIRKAAEHGDAGEQRVLSGIKEEVRKAREEREKAREQAEQERKTLSTVKREQMKAREELEETNAMLYNAKEDMDKKTKVQGTGPLTVREKEFIHGGSTDQRGSAGIIEAASAVVSSLKSKLKAAQDKIDSAQALLEEEREKHKKTKQKLESFRKRDAVKSGQEPEHGKDAP